MPYFDTDMSKVEITNDHKHMKLDRFGMVMSALCFAHCLGTPLLILAFPAIAGAHGVELWVHGALAVILIPVALIAVTQGYPHHRKRVVTVLAGAGVVLIGLAALLPVFVPHAPQHSDHLDDSFHLTVIGSLCLAGCHFLNMYYCRKHNVAKACHHSPLQKETAPKIIS